MARQLHRWLPAIGILLLAGLCGRHLALSTPTIDEAAELRLYPSGRVVQLLTLGQPTLLADIAWIEAIQYYGKHRLSDRRYPLAGHLFNVITDVDPAFESAYIFGALVLEEEDDGLSRSRELFAKGMRASPLNWKITFHRGFLEYLRGDGARGAEEMARAARLPGAPPYVARLAAHAHSREGSLAQAVRLWIQIAEESDEPAIQELARSRIEELRERIEEAGRAG